MAYGRVLFSDRRLTHFRVCFLFLALSLLFGLGIAGCTDKDREVGTASVPSEDIIKYRFRQDSASKVSAGMTAAALAAFDAGWNRLDGAYLLQSSIAGMAVDGDYIVAEAKVPEGAAVLAYCFTDGTADAAEYAEAEIYVIALEEGVTDYTMADGDLLQEPVLTLYADAEHQTVQSEFKVGEKIYPDAFMATAGGLEVPIAVMEPVDDAVVAYTAATETGPARYAAKSEGTPALSCARPTHFLAIRKKAQSLQLLNRRLSLLLSLHPNLLLSLHPNLLPCLPLSPLPLGFCRRAANSKTV